MKENSFISYSFGVDTEMSVSKIGDGFELEEIRPIFRKGEKTHYEISQYGELYSISRWRNRKKIKTRLNHAGYVSCDLQYKEERFHCRINRAVATAFIPNPDNLPEVNHKDANKLNNHVSNLEWSTRLHNMQHAFSNGLMTRAVGLNHGRSRQIGKFLDGIIVKKYVSIRAVMADGYNISSVFNVLSGRTPKHQGFEWRYL